MGYRRKILQIKIISLLAANTSDSQRLDDKIFARIIWFSN